MRDTWSQPEALTGDPEQQHQAMAIPEPELMQRQFSPPQPHMILAEALEQRYQLQQTLGLPLQSPPTTPAWVNDKIVVKEEPQDDKNNDSGISPGHYTSDSNCNGSLSPSSSASDQTNTQSGYDYSPQRYHSPEMCVNNNYDAKKAPTNHVSSTTNVKSEKKSHITAEMSPDPMRCPLCIYSTQIRLQFAEHLALHCSEGQQYVDQFKKSIMVQLLNKNQSEEKKSEVAKKEKDEEKDEDYDSFFDEPGVRVPRVTTQGKVKTFRCKQCAYVAITKIDFWLHSRVHIKPEKVLTCPKCPFVTEYKHHLEYHFRNHFGSKPFHCDQCNYTCVNKSMLNSHLKSHSNVYQFRCADCAYATKYCHSLKLHLRKYSHNPAMVLNADGTPNPLPIIDVYGTRRGPKAKPKKEKHPNTEIVPNSPAPVSPQSFERNSPVAMPGPNSVPNTMPQPVVPFQLNSELLSKINFNAFNGVSMPNAMPMPQAMPNLMNFPFNPMLAVLVPNPMLFGNGNPNVQMNEQQVVAMRAAMMEYANNIAKNMEAKTAEEMAEANFQQPSANMPNIPSIAMESQQQEPDSSEVGALDLTTSETTCNNDEPQNLTVSADHDSKIPIVVPTKPTKSRRKGRAVKLDRRAVANDSDDDMGAEP